MSPFVFIIQLMLVKVTWCALVNQREPGNGNSETTLGLILKISTHNFLTVCPWDKQMVEQVIEFINSSQPESPDKIELLSFEEFHLDIGNTQEYNFRTFIFERLENTSRQWLMNSTEDEHRLEVVFHKEKGGATLRLEDGREIHVRQGDYCISKANSEEITVKTRPLECSNAAGHSCVQKCCPIGHVLNIINNETFECARSLHAKGTWWIPQFEEDSNKPPISVYDRKFNKKNGCTENPHIKILSHSLGSSLNPEFFYEDTYLNFSVLGNGSVRVLSQYASGGNYVKDYGEYCIDGVQDESSPYSGLHTDHLVLMECGIPTLPAKCESSQTHVNVNKVYLIFIPFATIFIILTIIVYAMLWRTHNIHGKTLFGFLVGTLGFYVFLFLSRAGLFNIGGWECRTVAIGFHFFFLSYIAWLSAVNFDVWYTFRYLKATKATHKTGRVLLYCLFAFGLPMTIVGTSVVLDNTLGDETDQLFFRPKYGEEGPYCIFAIRAVLWYLVTPMCVLLVTNVIFFSWTIAILRQYQRSISAILKGTSIQSDDNSYGDIKTLTILRQKSLPISNGCRQLGIAQILPRVRLGVFVKIFVLTGVTWIFDVIGWFTMSGQNECGTLREGLTWVFVVVDTFNILLAVAIFFLFVWKQTIFDELWHRYPSLKRFLNIFILGKIFDVPKEKKMSITLSTLGKNGINSTTGSRPPSRAYSLDSRKVSTESAISGKTSIGSYNSSFERDSKGRKISFDLHRKLSSDSRKASIESRKLSAENGKKNSLESSEKEIVATSPKRKSSGASMCFSEGPELPVVLEEGDGVESCGHEDLKA